MRAAKRTRRSRALLLGARAPDLLGVDRDIQLMREALEHHEFGDIRTVLPATRDAMREAIAALIEDTQPGDLAVIYYSGHGSTLEARYLDDPEQPKPGEASLYRFLVPSDIEASSEDDFRGYTNIELSEDLAALTAKTHNVVMIMDCCHAGRVFRNAQAEGERISWQDPSVRPPARHVGLEGAFARSAARHYARLRASERTQPPLHAEANPWVVTLLASSAGGPALELDASSRSDTDSDYSGVMTRALAAALMRVDRDTTTWQDLGRMIRMTPQRGRPQQVSVEGPYRRFLFDERERAARGELSLEFRDEQILIAGGRLAGLGPGDEVELYSLERGAFVAVGKASIETVHSSFAVLEAGADSSRLTRGSYARVIHFAEPRARVELGELSGDARTLLEARLIGDGQLALSDDGDPDRKLPLVGELRVRESGRVECVAHVGRTVLELDRPRTLDPAASPRMTARLAEHLADNARRLAWAAMLRDLPAPRELERLSADYSLQYRVVEGRGDAARLGPMLAPGDVLGPGQPFTVIAARPRAQDSSIGSEDASLYCNVLLVRSDGHIRLLSRGQAQSVEFNARSPYCLGRRSRDPAELVRGVSLERPTQSVVERSARVELTLLAVVSDQPVDLRSWEQPGATRFNPRDPLQPASGARNLSPPSTGLCGARYRVERLELWLAAE